MITSSNLLNKPSNKITISGCTWNTGTELSNVNYLYFFIDNQLPQQKYTHSSLSIIDSSRVPAFIGGITNTINNIPPISIYSERSLKSSEFRDSSSIIQDPSHYVNRDSSKRYAIINRTYTKSETTVNEKYKMFLDINLISIPVYLKINSNKGTIIHILQEYLVYHLILIQIFL